MPAGFSFDYFSASDGLTQVFVWKSTRFVLLSSIFGEKWTIRFGLTGDGRWVEGIWSEEYVSDFASAAVRIATTTSPGTMAQLEGRDRIPERGRYESYVTGYGPQLRRVISALRTGILQRLD